MGGGGAGGGGVSMQRRQKAKKVSRTIWIYLYLSFLELIYNIGITQRTNYIGVLVLVKL